MKQNNDKILNIIRRRQTQLLNMLNNQGINLSPIQLHQVTMIILHKFKRISPEYLLEMTFNNMFNRYSQLINNLVLNSMKQFRALGSYIYNSYQNDPFLTQGGRYQLVHNQASNSIPNQSSLNAYTTATDMCCYLDYLKNIIETKIKLYFKIKGKQSFVASKEDQDKNINDIEKIRYPMTAIQALMQQLLNKQYISLSTYIFKYYQSLFLSKQPIHKNLMHQNEIFSQYLDIEDQNISNNEDEQQHPQNDENNDNLEIVSKYPNIIEQFINTLTNDENLLQEQVLPDPSNLKQMAISFDQEAIRYIIQNIKNSLSDKNAIFQIMFLVETIRYQNVQVEVSNLANQPIMSNDAMQKYKNYDLHHHNKQQRKQYTLHAYINFLKHFQKENDDKYYLSIEEYNTVNFYRIIKSICSQPYGNVFNFKYAVFHFLLELILNEKKLDQVLSHLMVTKQLLTHSDLQIYEQLPHLYTQLQSISYLDVFLYNNIRNMQTLKNAIFLLQRVHHCDIKFQLDHNIIINDLGDQNVEKFFDLAKTKCFYINSKNNFILGRNVTTGQIVCYTIASYTYINQDTINSFLSQFSNNDCYDFIIIGKGYKIEEIKIQYLNYVSLLFRPIQLKYPQELVTVTLNNIYIKNLYQCSNLINLYTKKYQYSYDDIKSFTKLQRFRSEQDQYSMRNNDNHCMAHYLFEKNKLVYIYVINDTNIINQLILRRNMCEMRIFYHEHSDFSHVEINLDKDYPSKLFTFINISYNNEILKKYSVHDFYSITGPEQYVTKLKKLKPFNQFK